MIYVVGIGPGEEKFYTVEAKNIIAQASIILGYPRQLESLPAHNATVQAIEHSISEYVTWIIERKKEDKEENRGEIIVVLASGDPTLYGIGSYLIKKLGQEKITLISGISSIQYLFSQINLTMNNCYLTSSHGKTPDFDFILQHKKVALVTDKVIGPYEIAQEIAKRGLTHQIIIGENLSYPDESIEIWDNPNAVIDREYQLNVVVITDER